MYATMRFTLLAAAALLTCAVNAQSAAVPAAEAMRGAAQKAIAANPEVAQRLNALRASNAAVDGVRGGLLPRVDLEAGVGRTSDRITTRNPEGESLSRGGVALSVNQLLWDANLIRSDIERAGHEQRARWFEFLDVTEGTALEAVRAHHDVMRQRVLVALAEDNYVQHKYANTQIESRVRAGVGRGVDLEQAKARLALAESNLTTETANLHDVTARYARVVGELPPQRIGKAAPSGAGLPASAGEAGTLAVQTSPAISAAIENLRAARATTKGREGQMWQPRVEARLRSGTGRNFDGVPDQKRDTSAEVVLNWNLYNGGSDQARVRQAVDTVNQASDIRDKTCRDTRQQAAIALNDTLKYLQTLESLDRNVLAIEKARDAYRQQFDIGQRSLLDLLNAENELFTARRAYANAESDLLVAQARTLAFSQRLTSQLGLTRMDAGGLEAKDYAAGEDVPSRCPALMYEPMGLAARAELDRRAAQLVQAAPAPAAAPAPSAPASAPNTAPTPRRPPPRTN
uniref:Membrane protein n=1 Tax=uncultured bacterium 18 TaxID=139916 RepID=A0A0U3UVK7_9BACT|nr:membrane protein [uncultured bacterium 18]